MCGITGFWNLSGDNSPDRLQEIVEKMSFRLFHRGPDAGGSWVDENAGIALGHRRLSILDLSPEGHQPMLSRGDRYVIIFNGEIYNFLTLRKELAQLGHHFRGHSDTEVMLASFCQWGIEGVVKRFIGMFAFALWDRQEKVLHLCRDRMGEKPLYYGWMGKTFLFGSELKSLKIHPDWCGEIDRNALALLLRHNYINAPHSIYKNIYKLPPGTLLSLKQGEERPEPIPYWSLQNVAEYGAANPFSGNKREAIAQLDILLRDAIAQQMVADVPLGAFLSGGIDSSLIVALMQAQSSQPVKTFSIGFHEEEYNEAKYAKAVAQRLGTDHTELYVTPQDALAIVPKLPTLYDEPFSDSSQIPTFLVAQLARQQVTVSLSGDAGDELFGGYTRYFMGQRFGESTRFSPLKKALASVLKARSPQAWDQILQPLKTFLPDPFQQRQIGTKLHRVADVLSLESPEAIYRSFVSHWQQPEEIVIDAIEPETVLNTPALWANLANFFEKMMYLDALTYLPGDILVKVDRAAMGVSLETRIPFLDHRVIEFAWSLPLAWKAPEEGQGKWILRQILAQYVPAKLFERPKMGFGIPIDRWLRGELRDWAENLLDEGRLRQEGYFHPQPIRQKWQEHLSESHNWQYYLWDVLMFQAWLEQNF
ncbi:MULTISPECIES: asparagine synthase (glutamine-hydrolyzing) [Spirulina sp. CCY15215]|uniref:asparagine synthase (glutamine-hydrolyzing) n=1 Tax=Spirulina sp. CCY15215 TaxID=2767591 RepID=UPI00194E45ED|nr:asparagine synthase (glutamine-hydrolyzing) [Spirulina major]